MGCGSSTKRKPSVAAAAPAPPVAAPAFDASAEEAKKKAQEAEAKKKAQEAEAKRKADEEAAKKKAEEEAKKKAEEEAKKKAEEEAKKKAEEEAKKKAEEEAKKKAEEEAEAKKKAEEEAKKAEEKPAEEKPAEEKPAENAEDAEAIKLMTDGPDLSSKLVVFVLGGPGSGKGTMCAKIVEEFGFRHLSAGDLLREETKSESEVGKMIAEHIKEGKIVPGHVTIGLLRKAIAQDEKAPGFLVDGFPRELKQAHDFEKYIAKGKFVLFFDCSFETLEKRLLSRGLTSGRTDDNIESIKKRFDTFTKVSLPVMELFEADNRARKINSERPIEEVYADVQALFVQEGISPVSKEDIAAKEKAEEEEAIKLMTDGPDLSSKLVVFVLGGPGSGKGTMCAKIVEEFGFRHLSAGDLLREETKSESEVGKMIAEHIREGKIVPGHVTIGLLRKAIAQDEKAPGFLVDGFPRELKQAHDFEKYITKGKFVLFFDCGFETLEKRLLSRGQTSGRTDDNIESIKKRFDTFTKVSLPVMEVFEADNRARKINSERPVDEVYADVQALFVQEGISPVSKGETAAAPAAEEKPAEEKPAENAEDAEAIKLMTDGPDLSSKLVVFVLGGPGSGKGTMCAKIVEEFGFRHLSAGDLLREETKSESEVGKMIAEHIKEGKIVPGHVTIGLLRKAIAQDEKAPGFLVDGFPREMKQAHDFEKYITKGKFVLFFDCSFETLEKRLLSRGQTSGRTDDNIESIKKRFDTFTKVSLPVMELFEADNRARKINSERPIDEVYADVQALFVQEGISPVSKGEETAPAAEGKSAEEKPAENAEDAEAIKLMTDGPDLSSKLVVFVLGGPGSGKGTMCAKIVEEFGFRHLSAGDLLREETKSESEVGKMIAEHIKEGKIVPGHVTIGLLRKAIAQDEKAPGFLVDGFPREMKQAHDFEKYITKGKFVLFFDCSFETLEKRLLSRGQTSGRTDDNIESIKKRFDTFTKVSLPVMELFEADNRARKINSERPIDEVYADVQALFVQEGISPVSKGETAAAPAAEEKPAEEKPAENAEDAEAIKLMTDGPDLSSKLVVFVLGGPGSGKGTMCAKIVEEFGFRHLSAGDLLREETKSESEVGKMIAEHIKEGKIVPGHVTIGLLRKAIAQDEKAPGFLVDGFPREMKQAHDFEKYITKGKFVLFFDCSFETLEKRLLSRGQTSGRTDDNIESIKKRFDTFTKVSLPVMELFEADNRARKINSERPIDEVYADVQALFVQEGISPVSKGEETAPAAPAEAEAAPAPAPAPTESAADADTDAPAPSDDAGAAGAAE